MAIKVRSARELDKMRAAGKITAQVLQRMREEVRPGISTGELDAIAEQMSNEFGVKPAFKGYHGFPATICASVNEEVVHGIPSPTRILKEGDIVKIDYGCIYQGWHGDAAITVPVGQVRPEVAKLVQVTEECLYKGIEQCRAGNRVGDISHAVQSHAEAHGFGVVYEYSGHGLGVRMHEEPSISHVGKPGTGIVLRPGMTFTIEPMINMGTPNTRVLADKWTVVTGDGRWSAQFEHSVAITTGDPEILTRLE